DHPACSLIIDPEDKTYTKYKLFTDKEMNEIKTTKLKTFIERLPPDFANYLNNFNLSCAKELREQLQQPNDWELYESQALEDMHEESWYNSRVWFLLDTAFDDIKSLQVIERTKIGHKCDMIIREKKEKHEYVYEYCVGESKPRYESTSTIEERAIKLPNSMKDMLDALIRYNHDVHDDLAVFGVQHTGLTITFLAADRPSPYITRINHVTSKQISSNISLFGATVLPVVVLVWQIKQQVIMMKSKILASQSNQARQRSEWLQHCLDPEPQTAIPTTSSSTEFVSKKRKTNKQ
ncbi:hypothetical protein FB192DRAFT_1288958, partial [Mucor lusitanicus]